MKKFNILFLTILLVSIVFPNASFTLDLYDDFSGDNIDQTKWLQGEYVREIQNGKLVSKITAYGSRVRNRLEFKNPVPIQYIEADVTITNIEGDLGSTGVPNYANPRAQLTGFFYNDGTASGSGSLRGEVQGNIQISPFNNQLWVYWHVWKSTDDAGTTWSTLTWGYFPTPVSLNTTYKLSIRFEPSSKRFTFKMGETTIHWISPDSIYPSSRPWKAIGTDVSFIGTATGLYGRISATFDNVIAKDESGNVIVSDDFSLGEIDETKWRNYEFVREISGGKLRSKVRSSSADTSPVNNQLQFVNPLFINNFITEVTLADYQNPLGLFQVAGISGAFYNDGTPGGGHTGDVVAEVGIGGTGTYPLAGWRVYKYTEPSGSAAEAIELASGSFVAPVTLGNTYTLSLGWNGSTFTFTFDNEMATYTPTTSINPVNISFKRLRTFILPEPDKREATIEALFDDVVIKQEMIANPRNVVFESTLVGSYRELTVNVTNIGEDDLVLDSISSPEGPFSRVGGTCAEGMELSPGESCTIITRFSPTNVGTFTSSFHIDYSNDRTGDEYRIVVHLSGVGVRMALASPTQGTTFTACSYYNLPLFKWDTNETFKSLEVQFSSQSNFSTLLKAKGNPAMKELQMTTAIWKKVLLLPGPSGGTVYWKVVGTKADKTKIESNVYSFSVEGPEAVGSPSISPTNVGGLPILSWDNNCNIKFKVWFGNDLDFTKAGMKKKALSFNLSNPNDNGGVFTKQLTSGQWTSIHKLVGSRPGSTIHWYVESWDVLKRYKKTSVTSFTLTP